jgi:hypothetical protein
VSFDLICGGLPALSMGTISKTSIGCGEWELNSICEMLFLLEEGICTKFSSPRYKTSFFPFFETVEMV